MDTGRPESVDTEIPKNRRAVKPNDAEAWVKTSVSLRASTRRRLKARRLTLVFTQASASFGFTALRFFGISVSTDSGLPVSAGSVRSLSSSAVRSRGRGVRFMFLTGPPPRP